MTQNEAPDPPNEDPTYERYQSSEQRGELLLQRKSFNPFKVVSQESSQLLKSFQ